MSLSTSTCLYIVIHSLDRWWVDCEGRTHGPFSSQEMAARSAVEIARIFGNSDRPWQVLSRDADGRYQIAARSSDFAPSDASPTQTPNAGGAE